MTEEAIPGFVQVPFSITRFENSIYWYIKGLLWQCLIIWLCFRQYCSWMALTLFLLSLLSFSLSIAQRSTCFRYYLTYMRKMLIKMLITMFVFLTMEMSSSDDYNFLKLFSYIRCIFTNGKNLVFPWLRSRSAMQSHLIFWKCSKLSCLDPPTPPHKHPPSLNLESYVVTFVLQRKLFD